jgi:hypothetical protein
MWCTAMYSASLVVLSVLQRSGYVTTRSGEGDDQPDQYQSVDIIEDIG